MRRRNIKETFGDSLQMEWMESMKDYRKVGTFLEVNQDGGRKVRGLKEGTEKGKGKNGVGRRKGGIQWGVEDG